jgi:hypothetical protein
MITKDNSNMWCDGLVFLAMIFCNTFARWTKDQSTESPILFRSCGHETPFSDQKGHHKSGIPCSAKDSSNCDAMCWFSGMLLSFRNNFARWLQKIVVIVMRCVGFLGCDAMCWVFWDAMIFCNNFARWTKDISNSDVLVFLGCYDLCNNFARW